MMKLSTDPPWEQAVVSLSDLALDGQRVNASALVDSEQLLLFGPGTVVLESWKAKKLAMWRAVLVWLGFASFARYRVRLRLTLVEEPATTDQLIEAVDRLQAIAIAERDQKLIDRLSRRPKTPAGAAVFPRAASVAFVAPA